MIRISKLPRVFVNKIFINNNPVTVEELRDELTNWAEKIIIIADKYGLNSIDQELFFQSDDKVSFAEFPYPHLSKTYKGKSGYSIDIYRRFDRKEEMSIGWNECVNGYSSRIDGEDIPFIFEPMASILNHNESQKYFTYSVAVDNPFVIYYDEDIISKEKGYFKYNHKTKLVIINDHINDKFLEDSLIFYRAIYDSENISVCNNVDEVEMNDKFFYLFIHSSVRVISPFVSKLFVSMQKLLNANDCVGFISPSKNWDEKNNKIIWGTKKAITKYIDKRREFSLGSWDQFVHEHGIVLDKELFEYYDVNSPVYEAKTNNHVYRSIDFIDSNLPHRK